MSEIKFLGYQGISIPSKLICWQTGSIYSHFSIMLPDKTCIEAYMTDNHNPFKGQVFHRNNFSEGHSNGTIVTVFDIVDPNFDDKKAIEFLLEQVGKPYDWLGLLRFITHVPEKNNGKWFCSEVGAAVCEHVNSPLQIFHPCKLAPAHLAMSTGLRESGELIVLNNKYLRG